MQWIDTEQANIVLPFVRTLFNREEVPTEGTLTTRDSDGRWRMDGWTGELGDDPLECDGCCPGLKPLNGD
ncbi:hypothetical protein [Nocardia tengchongensis]|uniref:hypothetical protein n=1 Tax=Nocardia tengchongensis TaxID=2055889 RepID=UPI00368D2B99